MTATDELRRMLDERGVEYEVYRDIKNRCITRWRTYQGAFAFFAVEKEGELFVETASDTEHSAICTPDQAIAATLGSGECKVVASFTDGLTTAELIAKRDESIHNLVKLLDKRQERIKSLESLVRDMRNLMATPAWDRGGWSTDGKCVEFDTRMAELGIEVDE